MRLVQKRKKEKLLVSKEILILTDTGIYKYMLQSH